MDNMENADGGARKGLRLVAGVQHRALEYTIAQALTGLAKTPEGGYKYLGTLLERRAGDDPTKRQVAAWVRSYLSPGSPGSPWLKHVLTSVAPSVRRRYIARFITNVILREGPFERSLPDGRKIPVPATIVISPTMRCNLNCVGCYAGSYGNQDELSKDEVIRILSEARALGTKYFVISGGEPFVYKPLFDVAACFDDCSFQIYTNGHLITKDVAERIVALGNVVPAISVEGFEAETDARRGKGAYARVMQAMDNLREAGAMFAFSVTVTRLNLAAVTSDAFMRQMVDKGAHYGWYFSYMPIGRAPDLSLMPTPEERNYLRKAVQRFRKDYPMLVADFWNDGALTEGCLSGGRQYLHINNHGDVEPCVFQHFAVDNIHHKSLSECLSSDYFVSLRKAWPFGRNLLRPCPIIDHPQVLRGLVRKCGARPTHDGAEAILEGETATFLDDYSKELAEIYDPIWAKEYRWAAQLHGNPKYDWGQRPALQSEQNEESRLPTSA